MRLCIGKFLASEEAVFMTQDPVIVPVGEIGSTTLVAAESFSLAEAARLTTQLLQASTLQQYQERKAPATLRRQRTDLALFERCLASHHIACPPGLADDLADFQDIEVSLVELFVRWQLAEGYALPSINARLATVKRYAQLAHQAGYLSEERLALIKMVKGYGGREAHQVDAKRETRRRAGSKKAEAVELTPSQVELLKARPATPDGRRDRLLVCLLFDHVLRVSEVAALNVGSLNLQAGLLTFYRQKTHEWDRHELTPDTLQAARVYLKEDRAGSPADTPLFVGKCSKQRMDVRTIRHRIRLLGSRVLAIPNLSPHDGRHFGTYDALDNGTTIDRLQALGGWKTTVRPLYYAKRRGIGNKGVKLSATKKYEQPTDA